MTVPFNSAVINGGAYPVVWAEGSLEADALSTAGADRTAYASPGGAVAESSSSADPVRLARLAGDAEARGLIAPFQPLRITPGSPLSALGQAESTGVPYRARVVDGLPVEASAYLSSPEPQRLARLANEYRDGGPLNGEMLNGAAGWADGLVAGAEALTDNRVINARLIAADGAAESTATASSPDAPITRVMAPRRLRTASLCFTRSQDVSTIRVRQVPADGPAIARARSRATPNTILGVGWSYCDAESSLLPSGVYVARATYPSSVEAEAEAVAQPHLVRIIEFLFWADAVMLASPDIVRDGVRYAHADGEIRAEANASQPIARRFPLFDPVPCEGVSEASAVPRFEPRSRAIHEAEARSSIDDLSLEIFHRVPASLTFGCNATSEMTPTTWRDAKGEASAEAEANVTATRLISQEAQGQALASADAQGDNIATLYMTGQAAGESVLSADGAKRLVVMTASDAQGAGGVTMEASVYTIVSIESADMSSSAESGAIAIRIRKMVPEPMPGVATIPPRSFKINAGDPASAQRTYSVPRADRHLLIPASPREYRIT